MLKHVFTLGAFTVMMIACNEQDSFNDNSADISKVAVMQLSPEMTKIRDYVPQYPIIAHRGSTFWTPEETESAYRWARNIGADYLEADLQISKDGVVLALHDDNLKRTTNYENVFGETFPEALRREYYQTYTLMSDSEIETQIASDRAAFIPAVANSYMYWELMKLDAGKWFNDANPEQARSGFVSQHQYISTLEDLIRIGEGKKLKRKADATRDVVITKEKKQAAYTFLYEVDDKDSGNRPGVYIEFKEPWLNPALTPIVLGKELSRLGWNIIDKPISANEPWYKDEKVNIGNTNAKVILQTFSLSSLKQAKDAFQGKIPMCFLLWKGSGATDIMDDSPQGYASFINLGIENFAHFMGPAIAGAPNNYPEMLRPWQASLIRKSNMRIHAYSFDTMDQMKKYFGDYNYGNVLPGQSPPPYVDGMFTNRSEMTIDYYISKGVRPSGAPNHVKSAPAILDQLGY